MANKGGAELSERTEREQELIERGKNEEQIDDALRALVSLLAHATLLLFTFGVLPLMAYRGTLSLTEAGVGFVIGLIMLILPSPGQIDSRGETSD